MSSAGRAGGPAVVAIGLGCAASMADFNGSTPSLMVPGVPGAPSMSIEQVRSQVRSMEELMMAQACGPPIKLVLTQAAKDRFAH